MRSLGGLSLGLLLAGALFGQHGGGFSGAQPRVVGGFGSVVFPGGTPATNPNISRGFGSAVFPGGGGPRVVVPGSNGFGMGTSVGRLGSAGHAGSRRGGFVTPFYAYPVYVGVYDDSSAYSPQAEQPAPQAPPQNITIVYPPQYPAQSAVAPAPSNPTGTAGMAGGDESEAAPSGQSTAEAEPAPEQPYYMLAFKNHTIYSAVAYWVDGETIHYFTSGNKHNQASLSLLDRPLTERLNKKTGYQVTLPPAK